MGTGRQIVRHPKESFACRADTESVKEIPGDDRATDEIRFTLGVEACLNPTPRHEFLHALIVVAQGSVSRIGKATYQIEAHIKNSRKRFALQSGGEFGQGL